MDYLYWIDIDKEIAYNNLLFIDKNTSYIIFPAQSI